MYHKLGTREGEKEIYKLAHLKEERSGGLNQGEYINDEINKFCQETMQLKRDGDATW